MRLGLSWPLRLGVLIKGSEGPLWQRFVYNNHNEVYLYCGCFHHLKEVCSVGGGGGGKGTGLCPENVVQARGEERGAVDEEGKALIEMDLMTEPSPLEKEGFSE